jgi:hypothetical protein
MLSPVLECFSRGSRPCAGAFSCCAQTLERWLKPRCASPSIRVCVAFPHAGNVPGQQCFHARHQGLHAFDGGMVYDDGASVAYGAQFGRVGDLVVGAALPASSSRSAAVVISCARVVVSLPLSRSPNPPSPERVNRFAVARFACNCRPRSWIWTGAACAGA